MRQVASGKEHLLMIGHNPALEELVSFLTSSRKLWVKLPTAAIAMLTADIEGWPELGPAKCRLTGLIAPKFLKAFE
jgi:phosphohistidine phosphatase SixA